MRTMSPLIRQVQVACCGLAVGVAAVLVSGGAALAQAAGTGENVHPKGFTNSGTMRFYEKGIDPKSFPPSLALRHPVDVTVVSPAVNTRVQPQFWTGADGRHNVRIDIDAGTSLYGTGEIAGPLLRNGRRTTAWNTDAYGYTEEQPSLYQSHPWVLAVRADGTAFGVLADTTWRVEIDLTGEERGSQAAGSIVFRGEGAKFPVYVIDRPTPQDVVKGLSELIGTMPMPPLWAIGYHQCRYSYYPEARVREMAKNFRDRKIPCDVIWFDIDYMDEFRVFSFNKTHFPDPKKLNEDLGAMGFNRIWMINPGVKDEPGFWVNDQLDKNDFAVKNAKGEVYRGEVWPGWCNFPDYTRPDVRQWWHGLYKDFMAQGVNGVWNDMNEPAVFNVKSKTMPEDNVHKGGAWDYGGTLPTGPHLQYHNVYGMLMAKGTFDGILKTNPDKRPFVLTRAGYIGSHRYAATWTGDNSAEWDDLEHSVSMAANLGLSGAPFIGPDIGGFNGNGPIGPTPEETTKLRANHFARWMGIGALLPFSRGHTGKGNIDKEPWSFGPEVEQTCRLALERRYRLMPYLYTLFREAYETGLPVLRPVFFADPTDAALRSEDDAFLLGSDLLVVPQLTPARDRSPVLPKGIWNEVVLVGEGHHPDLPKLFVRGGAIIPVGPTMEYTGQKKLDPLTLIVSLDSKGTASGVLYEDAGDGWSYQKGDYLKTTYTAKTDGDLVRVEISGTEGQRKREQRTKQVILVKDGKFYTGSSVDGQALTFVMSRVKPQDMDFRRPAIQTEQLPVPGPPAKQ